MLLQPLRIHLRPQNPAPMDSTPRWPASGQGPGARAEERGQGRLPGEGAFPASQAQASTELSPSWDRGCLQRANSHTLAC